ncbi:acyl-CoA dehydrogenase family protein [Streptomyces sp. AK08-02]|uniref:acyl-CoA dehydrogenase family protein n=1 Tax=Streptomyces sp. AK08-02 TaxID=3028654 RepID=UPI0029AD7093|nr:acyl-CoA dehydrogenase family protein [Streptomyces sp. AK08-02]MDX3752849.1 acyl-CoA/acyl-ACP dehydrogenase [Streptomyces sp. AK08-02]
MNPVDGHDTALAVETAGEYLGHVARWLNGRTAYGGSLMDHGVLRQRLALGITAHRAAAAAQAQAQARTGPEPRTREVHALRAAAVSSALDCVRRCQEIHAGAGVFDTRPDTVRRIHLRLPGAPGLGPTPDHLGLGPLGRLDPPFTDRLAKTLGTSLSVPVVPPPVSSSGPVTAEARRLVMALQEANPAAATTLLDDVITAEALARLLPPGLAARVMTHRQVVRSYLTGPGAAPASARILQEVRAEGALVAVAVTEPQVGSDLSALRTTVRRAGPDLMLDGTKTYVAGAADCDFVLVAARCETGLVLAWADTRRPEVHRRPLPTRAWRGVGFAALDLRSYALSERDLHRGEATGTLLTGLIRERLILAAQQLAYARRWIADIRSGRRTELARRTLAAQALLEAVLRGPGAPSMADSGMAKVASCAVALEVAEARTEAAVEQGPRGVPVDELLDDEASAKACTFAGGTADLNLALVEGNILSLLAPPAPRASTEGGQNGRAAE